MEDNWPFFGKEWGKKNTAGIVEVKLTFLRRSKWKWGLRKTNKNGGKEKQIMGGKMNPNCGKQREIIRKNIITINKILFIMF